MPAPYKQSSFVNSIFKGKDATEHRAVFTDSLPAGIYVIGAFVAWNYAATDAAPPVTSITDDLGNSYTILAQVQTGNSSHHFIIIFGGKITVPGAPTIKPVLAHDNAYNSVKGRAFAYDCFYDSPADKVASAQGGPSATGATTGAQTLSQSAPFFVFSAFTSAQTNGALSQSSGLTLLDNSPVNTSDEQSIAIGYKDETAASSAGGAVAWTCAASVNGTVAVSVFFRLGCRSRSRVSTAGNGATNCTVETWPSGDPATSLAVRVTGKTVDSNGYLLAPVDPAWGKAVGSTVAVSFTGTDAVTGTNRGHRHRLVGTVEIGVA